MDHELMPDDHTGAAETTTTDTLSLPLNASSALTNSSATFTLLEDLLKHLGYVTYRHYVPSVFFVVWGCWGAFNMLARMHRQRIAGDVTYYVNQTCFVWKCMRGIPYGSLVKVALFAYTVLHYYTSGRLYIGALHNDSHTQWHWRVSNYHHISMTSCFLMQSCFEAVVLWRAGRSSHKGSRVTDRLVHTQSFSVFRHHHRQKRTED